MTIVQKILSAIVLIISSLIIIGCPAQQQRIVQVESESGIANLTQLTSEKTVDLDPSFTKDGSKVIFASDRSDFLELWMMPIKGGGIQQLTINNRSADRTPQLSPKEDEVVFQSTRVSGKWNIWKISLGNRGLTQLTNNSYGAYSPSWSPTADKILYSAEDKNGNSFIWIMGASGEEPTQLGAGNDPRWSPDGKKIVYSKSTTSGYNKNYDIWIMNVDGSNSLQMTTEKEKQEISPVWSPDGKWIAYVVKYSQEKYFNLYDGKMTASSDLRSDIWVLNVNGGKPTQLTAFKGLNSFPAWSPDGKSIAFISNRGDGWNVWTMVPNLSNK